MFMEMRTGKTLTMIRRALLAKPVRVLVMAPTVLWGHGSVSYVTRVRQT